MVAEILEVDKPFQPRTQEVAKKIFPFTCHEDNFPLNVARDSVGLVMSEVLEVLTDMMITVEGSTSISGTCE